MSNIQQTIERRLTEGSRIHETPESTVSRGEARILRPGDYLLKHTTENIRDDLQEELTDKNCLRAEILFTYNKS